MNLQQLEYIISIDTHRHFVKAADACHVTQATLSMMVKRLEEDLGVIIFDRSKQPVIPTTTGAEIIKQAKIILKEVSILKDLSSRIQGEISGEIRIGVIPTIAPYLLPLFLQNFLLKYPLVKVKINERTTSQITEMLSNDGLDVGIVATPLKIDGIREDFLYNEKFIVYLSEKEKSISKRKYVLGRELDASKLWMLEEGHCMRKQMQKVCELNREGKILKNLDYETGSVESLIRLVDANGGLTILPELAAVGLSVKRKAQLKEFRSPAPAREISLISYRHYNKKNITDALKNEIIQGVFKVLDNKSEKKEIIPLK